MGDWSMSITLSRYSVPVIFSWSPGTFFAPLRWVTRYFFRISFTSEDLPEPETPVTLMNFPRGNSTSIFLRLFSFSIIWFVHNYLPKTLFQQMLKIVDCFLLCINIII